MNQWLRFYRWEAKTNRTLFSYSWFFPLLRKWQVIARNSDWFVTLFAPVVIGRSVYLVKVFRQWVSEWVSVTIEPSIGTLQIFGPMFPDLWNFLWVDISLPFYFPPGDPIDISYSAHIICDPRAGISRWLVKTSWRKAPMKLHFHEVFFTVVFSRNSLFFPFFPPCLASVSGVLVPGVDVYGYIICLHTTRIYLGNKMAAAGVEEEDTELNFGKLHVRTFSSSAPSESKREAQWKVERLNLLNIANLCIKHVIDSALNLVRVINDEYFEPLQQFFVVFESILRHGLKSE